MTSIFEKGMRAEIVNMQKIQTLAQKPAARIPKFVSILIVDDERYDRARLRRICEKLDFDSVISEVSTLEQMGTALGRDRFDLIFLDFNMPDGNGLLALDAIQVDDKNRFSAIIMVTGDNDIDIAIAAMKDGCSDFVPKETVSFESIQRAALNALQKAALNRGLERETNMRTNIETVLNRFTKQCAEDIQPMLFSMMRHVRNLHAVRLDEGKFITVVGQIEQSCERLFDFVKDIEDSERKEFALSDIHSQPIGAAPSRRPKPEKARLFR